MNRTSILGGAVVALIMAAASVACGGDSDEPAKKRGATPNPADFQARVDNRFFSLTPGTSRVYEGTESDPETDETLSVRVESTVLSQTEKVAGVEATVVEVKDFEDGELAESTRDFFAQGKNGTVYQLGERVDEYEDGKVVGHGGQWQAGEGDTQAGIYLPGDPKVGDEFEREHAPGAAQVTARIVAADQTVKTPAGAFTGCVKVEEVDSIEHDTVVNFFCRDGGFVREDPPGGRVELISITKAP